MTFNKTILLLITLSLVSCSSGVTELAPKRYSSETNKSFEEIERENALERYRQLRLENWEDTKKGNTRIRNIKPSKYYRPAKPARVARPKPSIIPTNPEEQRIEVDQNLKFFCMEKRKDPKFNGTETCESYTENILSECENSYQWNDKKLTNCVKSKLK
ncbi:hypothetical protein [Halobacteriovorax sp. JY17]|uniref:hypothetical protein n=1 Tax=Halobacteriovorax sp. JY17 TaxID=2014617 RepID=UPI000C387C94|nr:hypothetical protein [Halobacteriovorax sp. JY17]PIK15355.1 MAG: hypothetical protein CES88_01170 [Halobacteriovorax sp. JY17]